MNLMQMPSLTIIVLLTNILILTLIFYLTLGTALSVLYGKSIGISFVEAVSFAILVLALKGYFTFQLSIK